MKSTASGFSMRLHSNRTTRLMTLVLGSLFCQLTPAAMDEPIYTSQVPMLFQQNMGQFEPGVDFVTRNPGYSVALGHSPVIELYRYRSEPVTTRDADNEPMPAQLRIEEMARFRIKIKRGDTAERVVPLEKEAALTHYLAGEPQFWVTDVPNFKRIRYEEVLDNIDVEYYGSNGRLEYDFVVHPGGDPSMIQLEFDGAQGLTLDSSGNLVINLGGHEIIQLAPVTYQVDDNGERSGIQSSYSITDGIVSFELAAWDVDRSLVIDPVIEYSSYYGGSGSDITQAVDLDAAGNIYVFSTTTSSGLGTAGAYEEETTSSREEVFSNSTCSDCTDSDPLKPQIERVEISSVRALLITKFAADGKSVIWSTYFNVPYPNWYLGINSQAVSASGEVAFAFSDVKAGLPLVNQTQIYDANQNAGYVAKLNASGSGLVFGTYLQTGNSFSQWVRGLDVSPSGQVAVSGMLGGDNGFPTVIGIPGQSCTMNAEQNENSDGFVALFDTSGNLVFSSCLGGEVQDGSSREGLRAINIGSNGHLYVSGYSSMSDFPMVNPVQATKSLPGARLTTISQINPITGALEFSSWLGPSEPGYPPIGEQFSGNPIYFWPIDIVTDSEGNIVVLGTIGSLSFPTVNAFQSNMGVPGESEDFLTTSLWGAQRIEYLTDMFITKLHPNNGILFSTYLGGGRSESSIQNLAIDDADNIYVGALTSSGDYPVINAIQPTRPSEWSPVVSKFTPKGALAFSSYLGDSEAYPTNLAPGVAVNTAGKIIVAGATSSTDFPVVGSSATLSGSADITLMIIDQSGDTDTDGDGVPDVVDAFPADDTEWRNLDDDLLGDNADTDDDGDEVADASDRFPQDGDESVDSDEDGAGDVLDEFDADLYNYFDFDNDGLADFDPTETDDDADGVDDATDAFDFDATEWLDTDGDWLGDNSDPNDDNDDFPDNTDPDRLDAHVPVLTFEQYSAWDTNKYKSPWPQGFSDVDDTDKAWTSATDQSHGGLRSFGSRIIDHDQTAAIQYTATFEVGSVEFWYRVDSEQDADYLTFKVDGQTLIFESGDSGWQVFFMPIEAGEHILEWSYSKDSATVTGADAAWIDDFKIIGNTIFESGFE